MSLVKGGAGLIVCWAILWTVGAASAREPEPDTWPQFRGPNRDGVSRSTGLLAAWPEDGPRELWRVPLGEGFSGIVVDAGRVYTMFAEGDRELLGCFDLKNGREIWRRDIDKKFVDEFGDGPRSAPTVDGDVVYALGSNGELAAVDKRSGEARWRVSFAKRFDAAVQRWGYSGAPLVDGERLLVETGGGDRQAFAAFNKKTGETLWTAYDGVPGYSSPIAVDFAGKRLYIALASQMGESRNAPPKQQLVAFSPDGKLVFKQPAPGFLVAMPVFVPPDKVFVSASNDDGCRLYRLKSRDDGVVLEELWANRSMRNHFNSSVYRDGYLYGFNNATLQCVDAASGQRQWGKRGFGKGSLTLADGKLLVVSDRGKLALIDAAPAAYREISSFQALQGKCWTSPTVVGGKALLRNQKEMVCFDLRK